MPDTEDVEVVRVAVEPVSPHCPVCGSLLPRDKAFRVPNLAVADVECLVCQPGRTVVKARWWQVQNVARPVV